MSKHDTISAHGSASLHKIGHLPAGIIRQNLETNTQGKSQWKMEQSNENNISNLQ